jgi:octaprenyl-diphosphate synthase
MFCTVNMNLRDITAPVERELSRFETAFAAEFGGHPSAVAEMCSHVGTFGGKKLRPVLMLLSGKAAGGIKDVHIGLAVAIELLHTATLIHDDVLDEAELRRHRDTVNARWDNQRGILLGDYIFSRTFSVVGSLDGTGLVKEFARITSQVSLGEIMQVQNRFNAALSENEYLDIIEKKTATLFSAAGRLGASYGGNAEHAGLLDEFGKNIGMAFQIIDDLLDLFGSENRVGKTLLSDARQGKMTLPLIRLLADAGPAVKNEIIEILTNVPGKDAPSRIRMLFKESDAAEYTRERAAGFITQAREKAAALPESPAKTSLLILADFILNREF